MYGPLATSESANSGSANSSPYMAMPAAESAAKGKIGSNEKLSVDYHLAKLKALEDARRAEDERAVEAFLPRLDMMMAGPLREEICRTVAENVVNKDEDRRQFYHDWTLYTGCRGYVRQTYWCGPWDCLTKSYEYRLSEATATKERQALLAQKLYNRYAIPPDILKHLDILKYRDGSKVMHFHFYLGYCHITICW